MQTTNEIKELFQKVQSIYPLASILIFDKEGNSQFLHSDFNNFCFEELDHNTEIETLTDHARNSIEDFPAIFQPPRNCSITGLGIWSGWIIGEEYFSTKELADKEAQRQGFKNFDELYQFNAFDEQGEEQENDFCYWTEWE